MLKKNITYTDLDGNKRSEDFYFNLSKAELAEMDLSKNDGMEAYIRRIIETKDRASLIAIFKDIIMMTVGRRSDDGRHFMKSEQIRNEFSWSDAYSELFMELVTDTNAAIEFINGVVPKEVRDKLDSQPEAVDILSDTPPEKSVPEIEKPLDSYTREELLKMDQQDFDRLVGTDPQKMKREHLVVAMQRQARSGG